MRATVTRTVAFVCFVTLSVLSGSAQTVALSSTTSEPLPVTIAMSAKTFAPVDLDLSPDGLWVAYTLKDPRRSKLQGVPSDRWRNFTCSGAPYLLSDTDLLITSTKTGQTIDISAGKGANWGPSWSPDGKSLAFYSDRTGKAHVWLWERATGKLRPLTTSVVHVRIGSEKILWTPDGRHVLTKILGAGQVLDDCFDQTTRRRPFNPDERSIYDSDSPKLRLPPSVNSFTADLALLDTLTGSVKRIVRQEKIVVYSLSPRADRVAYISPKHLKPNNEFLFVYDLAVVSIPEGRIERVQDFLPGVPSLPASWSPDGQTLAYVSDRNCFIWSPGQNPQKVSQAPRAGFSQAPLWDEEGRAIYLLSENKIWRVLPSDARAIALTGSTDRQVRSIISRNLGQLIWSPDSGKSLYVLTQNAVTKQEGFYRVNLRSGDFTKALETDTVISTSLDDSSNEFLIYAAQSARQEQNLWITKPDFASTRQLTRVNADLERYATGEARLIEYSSVDGQKLRSSLLLPVNYEKGRRYPLIVWVYGGNMLSANANRYGSAGPEHHNMQLLASRGFAVLLPDTPLRVGTPMQDLAKTVLPAVDKAIEMGIADPERLGIMGLSYGGYSTLALIAQTTRFKAAVMDVGMGNLSSHYGLMTKNGTPLGVSWAEEGQGRMAGPPWQFPERYVQNSPVFYLDKVQTPLLINQGGMDMAPFHSDEIFVGLRRLGKKVLYVRYENEGHGIENYSNRVDYWNRLIEWFNSNLSPAVQRQSTSAK